LPILPGDNVLQGVRELLLAYLTKRDLVRVRLQADTPEEIRRIEGVLASARVFLAVTFLLAIWLRPTEASSYTPWAYGLMVAYVVYSISVLAWVRFRGDLRLTLRLVIHGVDMLLPPLVSLSTAESSSPFFIFNAFVLLEAAYRWGLPQTLATAGAEVLFYFSEAFFLIFPPEVAGLSLVGRLELNRFVIRALYLVIMGYLMGQLGGQEKLQRAEVSEISRLVGKVQTEVGLRGALRVVLEELSRLFGSNRALLILRETATGRGFLWEGARENPSQELAVSPTELDTARLSEYLFDPPGQVWYARRRGNFVDLRARDSAGKAMQNAAWSPPDGFLKSHEFRSVLGAAVDVRSEWSGSLLLLDPELGSGRETALRLLPMLSQQISPSIYNTFLVRRMRSRIGAVERARVARELHDGVIQSLIGMEMYVDVLRRKPEASSGQIETELGLIQTLLRLEIVNIRELMHQMKPPEFGPKELLDFLASTVDKFRQETGIAATFVCSLQEVPFASRVRTEVARIVQEALINVRKHSGARNVVVSLEPGDSFWKLAIDDDGCGFDFSGRLSHAELDVARKGPIIIRERGRSIEGELTVESRPGRGSRLEIDIPLKPYG
jgi:signal transduction histidine kinase